MLDTYTLRTDDLPDEMRVLFETYPRDSWDAHPGFQDKTRHWLGAHRMFRHVAGRVRQDAEVVLEGDMDLDDYAGRLSRFGNQLVNNLHGHHSWEDRSFFPELSAADPRFDAGLAVLEADHAALDQVLDGFTRSANRAIKLTTLDKAQAREAVAEVQKSGTVIEAFLDRHLADEEELAVPIILHHRLRG